MSPEDLQNIFFLECDEALGQAETGLLALAAGTRDSETVNAIFRAVHSIKGGAGAFGHGPLQAFAHNFETLLSLVREGSRAADPALVRLLLAACDMLADHVAAIRGNGPRPDDAMMRERLDLEAHSAPTVSAPAASPANFDLDALLATLPAASAGPEPIASQPSHWLVQMTPRDAALANGGEPLLLLRELRRLGGRVTCDLSSLPPLSLLDVPRAWLRWDVQLPGSIARADIEEIFDFAGDSIDLRIASSVPVPPPETGDAAPATIVDASAAVGETGRPELAAMDAPNAAPSALSPRAAATQTIRVDLAKLERLFDTVGELVIAQAMLAQHLADQPPATLECLGLLDTLTRDLQDSVMAIRAQPVAAVFNRMPRLVRELAESTGKTVVLEISGEATELDKLVVERLAEPLTHLIRNAIDHGIEDAAARRAAGKRGEGSLRLAAGHRSGRIFITLADDGRGIDRPRVLAKAIERGLVPVDARLSDEEIDILIFAPGFSTASNVSSISGRGVGMDVVRQTVKELGGRITIQSEPGFGTVFTLTLPLTLAIADGMIVRAGSEILVVPLLTIIETLRPPADLLHQMGTRSMLNMRGTFVPVIDLADVARAKGCEDGVLIVVETEAAARVALRVDAILDNRQFVIKSLENHYRPVPGIAGATILGDGQVALIIDVEAMVARALNERSAA